MMMQIETTGAFAPTVAYTGARSFGAANGALSALWLGANGAQRTPERVALALSPGGTRYPFAPAVPYNLRAEGIILDHGDISRPEVAWAVWQAARATDAGR